MDERTTRQQIEGIIGHSFTGITPEGIANMLDDEVTEHEVIRHIKHINESREVMVMPPECEACGFDRFDNILNLPSQCPNCRATNSAISDPVVQFAEDIDN